MVAILLIAALAVSVGHARTTNVQPGQLKNALSSASPHDTIRLREGIYHETDLFITVPLVVIGVKGAVIDAQHKGKDVLRITSDSVVVRGLEIRNVKVSFVDDNAAIKVDRSDHVTIEDCTLTNAFFAVYLLRSQRCRVLNNTIRGKAEREATSGNGVHCWYGRDNLIKGNRIEGHRDGVYLEFMTSVAVENNVCDKNLRYGLHFMFSDSCAYRRNTFQHNGAGVAVMYSSYVEMAHNRFKDNWGASTYGLLLKDIRDSHIHGNRFEHNSVGVYAEAASRILFAHNTFNGNGYALKMLANCMDNTVTNNTFESNAFEVTTNSKDSHNHFDRNYWSSYEGYDLDRDGFGDVPHHPVRLYSLLVEQLPSSVVLMHSAFVNILDLTERVVPTLTPQTLIDRHPRIKPPTP